MTDNKIDIEAEINKELEAISNSVIRQLRKLRKIPGKYGLSDSPKIDNQLMNIVNNKIAEALQSTQIVIDGANLVSEIEQPETPL